MRSPLLEDALLTPVKEAGVIAVADRDKEKVRPVG
jgi:hypothetical protein